MQFRLVVLLLALLLSLVSGAVAHPYYGHKHRHVHLSSYSDAQPNWQGGSFRSHSASRIRSQVMDKLRLMAPRRSYKVLCANPPKLGAALPIWRKGGHPWWCPEQTVGSIERSQIALASQRAAT